MKTGQKPTLWWLRPRDMHAAMTYAGMAKQGAWIGRIREGRYAKTLAAVAPSRVKML